MKNLLFTGALACAFLLAAPGEAGAQRVCLSGCDGGGKVVQRFDPVAAQRMFDEAFFTIDSLTVAADSLEGLVDDLEVEGDTLLARLTRSIVIIDTLLVHMDSVWVLVDTLYVRIDSLNAQIDSLNVQMASISSGGSGSGSGGGGGGSGGGGGGCGTTSPSFTCGSTLSHYGVAYATVQIGSQCWFAENLRATYFCNGDPIPDGLTAGATASTPARGFMYPDSASTFATKGLFYNWYVASDARNVCPSGWHVPLDSEWQTLVNGLGGDLVAGGELKAPAPTWNGNSPGSGFNAKQTGHWMYSSAFGGSYENVAMYAWWWPADAADATNGQTRYVQTNFPEIWAGTVAPRHKGSGLAIRCLKD